MVGSIESARLHQHQLLVRSAVLHHPQKPLLRGLANSPIRILRLVMLQLASQVHPLFLLFSHKAQQRKGERNRMRGSSLLSSNHCNSVPGLQPSNQGLSRMVHLLYTKVEKS